MLTSVLGRALRDRDRIAVAWLLSAGLLFYLGLIVGHQTPFDYFGRLAHAIWNGHVWLDGAPLSELDPGRGGHVYNVEPPLPGFLLVALVPFGPPAVIETFLSALLGALTAVPVFLALRALGVPRGLSVWCVLFMLFGTTLWYTAIDARSWFGASVAGSFFGSIALWLAATKRSPILIGLAIGAATLARPPVVLASPGLLLLARRDAASWRELARATGLLAIGGLPWAALFGWYDWTRWGDPLSVAGPQLRMLAEPLFDHGRQSPLYIPRHLYAMFFSGPALSLDDPFFLRPRATGMAILLGSPAFVYLARAAAVVWASAPWRAIALCAGLTMLPAAFTATWGFEQYGYRYSLDYQPFLIVLLAVGAAWRPTGWSTPSRLFRAAVVLSIGLTGYFVVALKLFGFAP